MNGGSLIRSWPVALVLVASAAFGIVTGHATGAPAQVHSAYPVRIALQIVPGFDVDSADDIAPAQAEVPVEADKTAPAEAEAAPNADFAAAFAGIGRARLTLPPGVAATDAPPAKVAVALKPAAPNVGAPKPAEGILAVHFNLSDPFAPGAKNSGPIELTKSVKVNGADAGQATIRVTDGATIAIAGDDLGHLLSGAGRGDLAASLGGGFVTFDRIRRAGLEVRYDAASDRILLSS